MRESRDPRIPRPGFPNIRISFIAASYLFPHLNFTATDPPSLPRAGWTAALRPVKGYSPLCARLPLLIYFRILFVSAYYFHFCLASDFLASLQTGFPILFTPAPELFPHLT